jgi:hypothetical protein
MSQKGVSNAIAVLALVVALASLASNTPPAASAQQVTNLGTIQSATGAFSYQGRLTASGTPASGSYDLRFALYGTDSGGTGIGTLNTREDVSVVDGLFSVLLDFGADAFSGSARYLEISVRPGASTGSYVRLAPRQLISPMPCSLYAFGGAGGGGLPAGIIVMWSGSRAGIPAGWLLCDGTNGTPDLRNRFVMGAAAGEDPGAIAGSATHSHGGLAHTHTVDPPAGATGLAGDHTHTTLPATQTDIGLVPEGVGWVPRFNHTHSVSSSGSHYHGLDLAAFESASSSPSTDAASSLPPYYAVAFLMKQ